MSRDRFLGMTWNRETALAYYVGTAVMVVIFVALGLRVQWQLAWLVGWFVFLEIAGIVLPERHD